MLLRGVPSTAKKSNSKGVSLSDAKVREVLAEVVSRLPNISICEHHEDGRVNSITDEETLIRALVSICKEVGLSYQKPKERYWYDFMIENIPIQIKSSTGGTDNWSSAGALLYAITSTPTEEISKYRTGPSAFAVLKEHSIAGEYSTRLLPILCVEKNTGKVRLHYLTELNYLRPNPSNMPFQISWKKEWNSKPVQRSPEEATKFIMRAYKESIEKRYEQYSLDGLHEEHLT